MSPSYRLVCLGLPLLFGACGGSSATPDGGGIITGDDLVGTWSVLVSDVTLTVAFTAGGDVETVQAAPLTGDLPDCMVELIGRGTYTVADGSVELDTPTARQRTTGCTAPDSDEPISATSLQNFADALSGPYVLTETTLQLGTSYPAFHRVAD